MMTLDLARARVQEVELMASRHEALHSAAHRAGRPKRRLRRRKAA